MTIQGKPLCIRILAWKQNQKTHQKIPPLHPKPSPMARTVKKRLEVKVLKLKTLQREDPFLPRKFVSFHLLYISNELNICLCRRYIAISIRTIFYLNSLNIQICVSQRSRESNGVGLCVVMRITSHNYDVTNEYEYEYEYFIASYTCRVHRDL